MVKIMWGKESVNTVKESLRRRIKGNVVSPASFKLLPCFVVYSRCLMILPKV